MAAFIYDPTTVYTFAGLSLVLTFLLVYRMTRRGSGKRPSDSPPQKPPSSPHPGHSTPVALPARINEAAETETNPSELPTNLQDEMNRLRAATALTCVLVMKGVFDRFEEADRQIKDTFQKKFRESEETKRREFTLNEEEVAALKKLLDKVKVTKDAGTETAPESPASSTKSPASTSSPESSAQEKPVPSEPVIKLEGID